MDRWTVVSRVAAALAGGYAFTWGFMALGVAALFAVGMELHDAESLAALLGFLLFLTVFLWAFTARRLRHVWMVLAGGGALMAAGASLLQRALVA